MYNMVIIMKINFEKFKNHFFESNYYNDNYRFLYNNFNLFFKVNIFENDNIFFFLNDFLINNLSIIDIKKIYQFFKNKIKLF